MKSIVLQCKTVDEIPSKITDSKSDGFNPTLAIVFCAAIFELNKISDYFKHEDIAVFGMTTAGEIIQNEVFESSIAIMLLDINPEDFRIFIKEKTRENTLDVINEACNFAKNAFENPGILVASSGLATDGEEIVDHIIQQMGKNISLYGGLAGDDLQMQDTFVFSNSMVSNDGILMLIINNEKIELSGMATSGWEAVGVEKTITKASGNTVYTIDDQPALDFFIKYYNLTSDFDDESDIVTKIGVKYPLQVLRKNNYPVLRAPLMGNPEDRSLVFAGRIAEGAKVKFCIQPTFEIIDSTIEAIKTLKPSVPEADALIMFSCKARHGVLGPMMEDEVVGVHDIWDAPLVGLFTYGEIGNTETNISDFHNETCSLVVLREKQ